LTTAIVFSFASGIFHPYYVSFLAPFTAALIGAGVGQAVSGGRSARIVAPLAIIAGAVTELVVLGTIGGQLSWAKPLVIAVIAVCAGALAFALAPRIRWVVLVVAMAALFAAPATWAAETLGHATSSTFPTGGPASAQAGGFGGAPGSGGRGRGGFPGGGFSPGAGGTPPGGLAPPGAAPGGSASGAGGSATSGIQSLFGNGSSAAAGRSGRGAGAGAGGLGGGGAGGFGGDSASLNAAIKYAQAHGGGTIGVSSQSSAAEAILSSNGDVAGLGGFSGRESTVTASWIAMEVKAGRLRWVIVDNQGFGAPGDTRQGSQAAMDVVAKTCKAVTIKTSSGTTTMYDCQGRAAAIQAAAGGS
jgi:hypothetical protein